MKKIACLSALACVLAVGATNAFAGESTVTAGYAQGDLQGVVSKAKGFNLKYRYEFDESQPLGVIGSFTYLEHNDDVSGAYRKGQYYGITAGPAFRINDWASIYGVVGMGVGKFQNNAINAATADGRDKESSSDVGISYGAGLQFNPMENVALDFSYEQSRIRSVDVGTWIAGVGYRF
ncbi:outer membrane protein OmpX [Nissabacter sp. SGAir0207]|uniref:outer membrane protein OmpX n=1 Tax=Nissabacter sp. SGAir0207 TaxID=2126321 RepID=UPI0010CCBBB5|nr:outer membrane protein OmpX [Nissabacter sp. SGAir0207]QCR36636.1 outer membrane protein OmpX [Nissabacter sp. SGAir0207]